MQTTLTLDDDAADLARKFAKTSSLTFDQAVSELTRRGAQQPSRLINKDGVWVVAHPPGTPMMDLEVIRKELEEM